MTLQWESLPLRGRALVEASAGTGKTWTIAMLYLRLLVEGEGHTPEQIVVTTFTEAAAQELRGRIRHRVRDALEVLAGRPGEEPALAPYLARLETEAERLKHRLQWALLDLDRAPIGTLHGLCLRVLREHPLDTGSDALAMELLDEGALRTALIDDLWRTLVQDPDTTLPFLPQLLRDGRDWLQRSLPALLQPGLNPCPPAAEAVADCVLLDQSDNAPALRALADDDSLFKLRNSAVRSELRELADLLEDDGSHPDLGKRGFPKLSAGQQNLGALDNQFRTGVAEQLAGNAAFRFALRAGAVAGQSKRILRGAALAWCRSRYFALRELRLRRLRGIGYDDMIERVHQAVVRPGPGLADRLFDRWPVAMIDEFQDTDSRQYGLFDRLYRDTAGAPRGALLMVGDPKQAIYRFRGGDIHTYQRAARDLDARLTLRVNHRASRAMVQALNTLYARGGDGFRVAEGPGHFGYVEVAASARRDDAPWRERGQPLDSPLQIHALSPDEDPLASDERIRLAIESCADLIAETLAGQHVDVGDAPLHPGQIAVLLPRHADVGAMRRALGRRGIASSGASRSDVFSTDWARALQLQLWAWLNPAQGDAVRAALRSPLHGWPLEALHPSRMEAEQLDQALRDHAAWAERWRRAGIAAAVGALVDARCEALLADPSAGERAITDLRHLGELLAQAESEGHRGEALWHWLAEQREQPSADGEARQLRIDSDSLRVRLMTLHASKGLEFDWVLLPLMWNHSARAAEWPISWDARTGRRLIDLGSPDYDAAAASALEEDQRERLRVLYVALTRSVHRCDVWAMPPERPANARARSPLAEIRRSALDLLLAPLFAEEARTDLAGIRWSVGWPHGRTRLTSTEAAAPLPAWPALPPPRALEVLASFSSLTHQPRNEPSQAQDETADAIDTLLQPPAPAHPELLAWEPQRGTLIGNALHAVLERRDSDRPLIEQPALIAACLREYGCEPGLRSSAWVSRIAARLDAVLETDLGDGLRLAALPPSAQRAEMDFRLRLDHVSLGELRRTLEHHGHGRWMPASVPLRALTGLLNGKIDLVLQHAGRIHVLDYKSNRLGLSLDDYRGEALERAMDHSGYRFQALLYTLAVHRYLRQRLADYHPDRDLGEAWYLFLRGVGLEPGCGVWRHRFDPALIEAVDTVFAGQQA